MRPLNLEEPILTHSKWYQIAQWPVFMMPFRPFFLLASIWSVIAVSVWVMVLSGEFQWQATLPAMLWHAHEMIFAFTGAIAVGFLLTAAQTWTNIPTLSGVKLMALVFIWAATRLLFILYPHLLPLVILGQLAFWLSAIVCLSNMLIGARSKNNYQFIAVLTALCVFNVLFLLLCAQGNFASARTFSQLAVLGFMLLIGMVGGRVIPFFTARGLTLDHQVRTPRLDKALRVVSVMGMCGFALSQLFNVALNPGYLIVLAASIHLLRSGLWFNPNIRYIPLLWSLHLGYLLAAIGLLLCGLSFFIAIVRFTDALHLITLGGIGLTILAMIARVSLGHTGRALSAGHTMSVAFMLLACGAVIRALLPHFIGPHLAWFSSAVLWAAAFTLFSLSYFNVLTQKRVDGRRG